MNVCDAEIKVLEKEIFLRYCMSHISMIYSFNNETKIAAKSK